MAIMIMFISELYIIAAAVVFKESYEYRKAYKDYRDKKSGKVKDKEPKFIQASIFDYI